MKVSRMRHWEGKRRSVLVVDLEPDGSYTIAVPPFVSDETAERIGHMVQADLLADALRVHGGREGATAQP